MDFLDGIFFGKVGVAHLILDHKTGGGFLRRDRFFDPSQGAEKTDKDVENIGQKAVEDNLNDQHLINLDDLQEHVKYHAEG